MSIALFLGVAFLPSNISAFHSGALGCQGGLWMPPCLSLCVHNLACLLSFASLQVGLVHWHVFLCQSLECQFHYCTSVLLFFSVRTCFVDQRCLVLLSLGAWFPSFVHLLDITKTIGRSCGSTVSPSEILWLSSVSVCHALAGWQGREKSNFCCVWACRFFCWMESWDGVRINSCKSFGGSDSLNPICFLHRHWQWTLGSSRFKAMLKTVSNDSGNSAAFIGTVGLFPLRQHLHHTKSLSLFLLEQQVP